LVIGRLRYVEIASASGRLLLQVRIFIAARFAHAKMLAEPAAARLARARRGGL
jgi:hypothetical protein